MEKLVGKISLFVICAIKIEIRGASKTEFNKFNRNGKILSDTPLNINKIFQRHFIFGILNF